MRLPDYHIHTFLCGHASGIPEEYVKFAINANLKEIGFSDHAPLPEHLSPGITMSPDMTDYYIDMIEELRALHWGVISIKIGFEVDFPFHDSFDKTYLYDQRIDYLIGSCHFLDDWAFDNPRYMDKYDKIDINEVYERYYEILNYLAASKSFNIIGHFDLVKKFGHRPTKDLSKIVEETAKLISRYNIAVEINTAGLRKPVSEIYPSSDIVDILFSNNVPITLGSDSHAPEEVGYCFDKAIALIKKAGYRKIAGFEKRKMFDIVL